MNNYHDGMAIMPIRALSIYTDAGDGYEYLQIEKESSYNIKPISVKNHYGKSVVYAYQVDFTIYVFSNRFDTVEGGTDHFFFDDLDALLGQDYKVKIFLGNEEPGFSGWWLDYDPNLTLPLSDDILTQMTNATSGMTMDLRKSVSVTYEIESVEYRPRLKFVGSGYIRSLVDNANYDEDSTLIIKSYLSVFK
jgi:hypothetical protein